MKNEPHYGLTTFTLLRTPSAGFRNISGAKSSYVSAFPEEQLWKGWSAQKENQAVSFCLRVGETNNDQLTGLVVLGQASLQIR